MLASLSCARELVVLGVAVELAALAVLVVLDVLAVLAVLVSLDVLAELDVLASWSCSRAGSPAGLVCSRARRAAVLAVLGCVRAVCAVRACQRDFAAVAFVLAVVPPVIPAVTYLISRALKFKAPG